MHAPLKIEWAKKHIAEIEVSIGSLPDRYTSIAQNNAQTRSQWIKYELPQAAEIAKRLGLLIGDAVHNLHTALDYAWIWALMVRGLPITKRSKFPFRDTAEKLKDALAGVKIESTDPLFNCLVSRVKPYPAGNDALCMLHELDITDKHHLLIPLVNVIDVSGIATKDSSGVRMEAGTSPIRGTNPFYVDIPPDHQIKDNGKPSATVLFGKGSAAKDREVMDTLTLFTESVTQAVEAIGRIDRLLA